MNSSPLYSELDLVNLFVCMCLDHELPEIDNILKKEGYHLISIDRKVDTSSGSVKFDVLLSNKDKNVSLGFELKGKKASNLEKEQFDRYSNLSSEEYAKLGGVSSTNPQFHQLQTIIGINSINSKKVIEFIKKHHYKFPILAIDSSSITVKQDRIVDSSVHQHFERYFKYQSFISFIKFDKDTPLIQIAPSLITSIFKYAQKNKLIFTVDEILK
ncbi:hypothetical protein [Tenuibacillus multivorans]|uniref:Uncharacterized protein n=1 Tax=Tenuibacillus multivorans TaxID=237069 RepID=A0A1H0BSZ6_9BACI|nr:hypothetical protein [Tenuibacillus multivorans]GEL77048.1 hypothetical protein TMU01_12830 [Tenuibacillus multivorans]SDN48706.1 hypothetical protein SAMN05216498_2374 [Tenuibacillus multivorans]